MFLTLVPDSGSMPQRALSLVNTKTIIKKRTVMVSQAQKNSNR